MADIQDEKRDSQFDHLEAMEKDEKQHRAKVDYTGSSKKTDPLEIKLVRKIDFIMMPMLWIMVRCYVLTVTRGVIMLIVVIVLFELPCTTTPDDTDCAALINSP